MPSTRPGPRYDALLALLRTADVIWNASHALFARWDLSPSQFNILNLLGGCPEGLSQTDLGRRLVMHRSNLTGLVDRLEQRGLVARHESAGDRRAWRVRITPAGTKVLGKILPLYHAVAEDVWGRLPVARVKSLGQDLSALEERARQIEARLEEEAS